MNRFGQTTAVIRGRGQLTIPGRMRRTIKWLKNNSLVAITASFNQLVIRQYKPSLDKVVDWQRIWNKIQLSRSFKGKRGNLSQFITIDREQH